MQRLCPRTVRACSSQDLKHGHVKLKSTSTCRLMPKPDGGTKPSDDKDVNMALSLTSVCTLRKPGVLSTPLALPSIFQFTKKNLDGSYLTKGEYAAHLRALRKCNNQEEKSLYESTWKKRRTHEITVSNVYRINGHLLNIIIVRSKAVIIYRQGKTKEKEQVRGHSKSATCGVSQINRQFFEFPLTCQDQNRG